MEDTTDIIVTDQAANKVKELLSDPSFDDASIEGLRVFIQGGGCSGFSYGFTFEETIMDGDTVIEKDDVKFLIDPMSLAYLMGAKIDYRTDLLNEQFVVDNPNATTTCGCGSSFSV
jgi:iron-sulfur cluster insertion protein